MKGKREDKKKRREFIATLHGLGALKSWHCAPETGTKGNNGEEKREEKIGK